MFMWTLKNVTALLTDALACLSMSVPSSLFMGPTSNLLQRLNKIEGL